MIKITMCLVRLPHLSREQFQDYWLNKHGPLVKRFQDTLHVKRYVQTHSLDPSRSADLRKSRNGPEQFDGVAEMWFESFEDLAKASQTAEAREAFGAFIADEKKFIDLAKSPIWWGEEKIVVA